MLLGAPEFAMMDRREAAVFGVGSFGCSKWAFGQSFTVNSDIGDISFPTLVKMNTLKSCRVVFVYMLVSYILSMTTWTQIAQTVIQWISVFMIYIFGFGTIDQFPNNSRTCVDVTVDSDNTNVPVVSVDPGTRARNTSGMFVVDHLTSKISTKMVARTNLPYEVTRTKIVVKAFLEIILRRQYLTSSHGVRFPRSLWSGLRSWFQHERGPFSICGICSSLSTVVAVGD